MQRQLAADNHLLVYKFMRDRNLPTDEWYGICAIGLCKAAAAYDPGKGKSFSTLAYIAMFHEVGREMTYRGRQMRAQVPLSLDSPSEDGMDTLYNAVKIQSIRFDTTAAAESRMCAEQAMQKASGLKRGVFWDYVCGFRFREIGKRHGITYQRAQQIVREMKADIRACMEEGAGCST